ncbi:MAG: hypothetical protein COB08_010900 [Rhodobacteraceae bacterium]|nr:hypothetical protein [Paracoccaceae bacterium]
MRDTKSIRCDLFDKVRRPTRGNRLTSPFNKGFDANEWSKALEGSEKSERDINLSIAALFIGGQLGSLRKSLFNGLFSKISQRSAIRLAVASANFEFFSFSKAHEKVIRQLLDRNDGTHIDEFRNVSVNHIQDNVSPDDFVTAIVDVLPHWFFEAQSLDSNREPLNFNFSIVRRNVSRVLSIEHLYKNIWDEALWEGWKFGIHGNPKTFEPLNFDDRALWTAWQLRGESLVIGKALTFKAERRSDAKQDKTLLPNSIISYKTKGNRAEFVFGRPKITSVMALRQRLETIEESYLSDILDQPVSLKNEEITLRLMFRAQAVLADAATAINSSKKIRKIATYSHVKIMSFGVKRKSICAAISRCLSLSPEIANEVVSSLTISPDDTGSLFRDGLWTCPLVRLDDGELLIVAAPLLVGSPMLFMEKYLAKRPKELSLAYNKLGFIFEKKVRQTTINSLNSNELINDFMVVPHALNKKDDDGEEIDMLLRIGNKVLICEVKSYVSPHEPIDRFNHIEKLEEAASQAVRKARWTSKNFYNLKSALNFSGSDTDVEFLPVVIINQMHGSGLEINGCLITDYSFWELYLSGGTYVSSSVLKGENQVLIHSVLYANEVEAISKLAQSLKNPAPLIPYLKSVSWAYTELPTSSGKMLRMATPKIDSKNLVSPNMNDAIKLLA